MFSLSCDPAALWISPSGGVVFSAGKIHTSPESVSLDHYSPCHNIIHSSVVLVEEQRDKRREKKRNGEIFV